MPETLYVVWTSETTFNHAPYWTKADAARFVQDDCKRFLQENQDVPSLAQIESNDGLQIEGVSYFWRIDTFALA